MVEHINSSSTIAKWEIFAETISDSQEFWEVVNRYKGEITDLELTFVAPNIFGGRDKTTERLKILQKENNIQTVSVNMHNEEGKLSPDSEGVRQSVNFVTEGGGRSRIKTGKKLFTIQKKEQKNGC